MAMVVLATGGAMVLLGLAGFIYGLDLLPTERGMAGVIAAVTGMTGGVITLALGLVLRQLESFAGARAPALAEAPRRETPEPLRDEDRLTPAAVPAVVAVAPAPPAEPDLLADAPVHIEPPKPRAETPKPAASRIEPPKFDAPKPGLPKVETPRVEAPRVEAPKVEAPKPPAAPRIGATLAGLTAGLAGAAVLTAPAKTAKAADPLEDAISAAIGLAPPPAPPPAEDIDIPVEVLTPVETTLHDAPVIVAPPAPAVIAAVIPAVIPAPVTQPPIEDIDPLADFEAELDRLIPLRPKDKTPPVQEVSRPAEPAPAQKPDVIALAPAAPPEPVADVGPTPEEPAAAAESPSPSPAPGAEVVGAYESGGAKYTMYSDGSVIAEAEGQTLRFTSLEELRDFIDGETK